MQRSKTKRSIIPSMLTTSVVELKLYYFLEQPLVIGEIGNWGFDDLEEGCTVPTKAANRGTP